MYRKQIRRRRAVLLLLVAASLTLLSLYYQEGAGGPLHTVGRGVGAVLSPFGQVADGALKPVRDLINWFDETFEARGENDRLSNEVAELRDQLAQAEAGTLANRELRRLARLAAGGLIPPGREPVSARVVARSPTVWYSTVTINRGRGDGIAVDDPVVTGDGLVGRVSQATGGTSQVTLISDASSSVAARVVPIGATGVVEPRVGDPRDLLLNFVQRGRAINEGQMVVTAGFATGALESLFPPGIPIGEVTDSSLREQEAHQRVHLRPFADLRNMQFVQVLARTGGEG